MGINLPAKNVIIDAKRWQFSKEHQQMQVVDIGKGEYDNLGGRAGRFSLEPDFGRSILVTSSEFEVRRLKDIYIKGGFDEATPRLNEMPLEDVVLSLCASHIASTERQLLDFLLATYTGRNLWSRQPPSTSDGFEQRLHECVARLLRDGLLTSGEDDAFAVSELGRIVSRSCICARTGVMLSQWARDNRAMAPTPLETLLLVAQTRDSFSVYLPLARSEWQDDRYLKALYDAAGAAGLLERPILARLIDPTKRPSFEQTRAIKRALILLDWINEAPLGDIEQHHYQAWPGLVQKIGETDSWLCDSLSEICRLHNWPATSLDEFAMLVRRLSCGLFDDALRLGEQMSGHTTRAVVRQLVDDGITSIRKLKQATFEQIAELIGHTVAANLRPVFHLKAPQPPAPKVNKVPQQNGKDGESDNSIDEALKTKLVIDTRNLSVTFRGEQLTLTPKCFKLLLILAKRASQFVHKEVIYQALWGTTHPDSYPYEKQIADHKGRLRKEFMDAAKRSAVISEEEIVDIILTKYGVGYQLALRPEDVEIIG